MFQMLCPAHRLLDALGHVVRRSRRCILSPAHYCATSRPSTRSAHVRQDIALTFTRGCLAGDALSGKLGSGYGYRRTTTWPPTGRLVGTMGPHQQKAVKTITANRRDDGDGAARTYLDAIYVALGVL
eukprot:scaffold339_cov402-Prasinococcus_capsulatus_cf.AAC.11